MHTLTGTVMKTEDEHCDSVVLIIRVTGLIFNIYRASTLYDYNEYLCYSRSTLACEHNQPVRTMGKYDREVRTHPKFH